MKKHKNDDNEIAKLYNFTKSLECQMFLDDLGVKYGIPEEAPDIWAKSHSTLAKKAQSEFVHFCTSHAIHYYCEREVADWLSSGGSVDKFINKVDRHNATSGHKKYWEYFNALIRSEKYEVFLDGLRKSFPEIFAANVLRDKDQRKLPPDWVDYRQYMEVHERIEKFCIDNLLHPVGFADILEFTIYYNDPLEISDSFNETNLCMISDIYEERADRKLERKTDPSYEDHYSDYDDILYPIAVRISPYATENDIINFVKGTYSSSIKPSLDRYKLSHSKIGRIRSKNPKIKARNDYIYQNRNLPYKKILDLVMDKFGINTEIDEGHIGKIISLENKRRKEL